MRRALFLALACLFPLTAATAQTPNSTPVYGYKVVATFPHATTSYTEGFFYLNGHFYEGTGLKGHSQLLVTDPHHIALPSSAQSSFESVETSDTEASPNGNSVSLEQEMIKVSDTQAQFQAATNLYSKALSMMRTAIGQP